MLKVLAQVAQELDVNGYHKDADAIYNVMEKVASEKVAKEIDYEKMAKEVMDKMPGKFKNLGSLVSKLKNMGFESAMSACEFFEDED